MLSSQSAISFNTLGRIVEEEASERFQTSAMATASELNARGLYHSSVHILGLDKLARDEMTASAAALYSALVEAHKAEPVVDIGARIVQLQQMFSIRLEQLAHTLIEARDARLVPLSKGLLQPIELPEIPRALTRLHAQYGAKIQLLITGIANQQRGQSAMGNTFNVNAPVGAIQTGDNSTSVITQTVTSPDRSEVLSALQVLTQSLQASQTLTQSQKTEVVEVVNEIRVQANLDSPNKLKLGALLGGLASVVQTIPNVAPAWQTLVAWSSAIRNAVN